jgi:hypothetical protein
VGGAILVALLSVVTELAFGALQRRVVPTPLRRDTSVRRGVLRRIGPAVGERTSG